MDSGILAWIIPLAILVGGAIGWFSRQYWQYRAAKRQAAFDADKILHEKKKLLEEVISKTEDKNLKKNLATQLDEVHAALLGLYTERLRHTLRNAGLPPENALISDGMHRLKPKEANHLKLTIDQVATLPEIISVKDMIVLGNAYYYTERYEQAKNIYNKILNLNPDDAVVLCNRGMTYTNLKIFDKALADLNKSLNLSPNDPATLYSRGNAYFDQKRYDEALIDYDHSLNLRPNDFNAIHNRALTYMMLNRYEDAVAELNRCIRLMPEHPNPYYNLACLFSRWGKPDEALDYLKKAITIDKKYREKAKTDEDFDNIRDDPRFKKLIGED